MNYLSRTNTALKRTDIIVLLLLLVAVMVIYYPVFYAEYLYTDEATQLWLTEKGINLTSIAQGRWITYKLFSSLFSNLHTTHAVIYARLFSLTGWLICLPVWYYILKDSIVKNKLPAVLTPLSMVYLVCMPPFAIYIGWAACLEMFIACTAGLLAGHAAYTGIQYKGSRMHVSITAVLLSFIAGMIALFTYQNGFGCFFISFFIQFITSKKLSKNILAGMAFGLLLYGLYYLLFKWSLHTAGMEASNRGVFASSPVKKILFFFTRPLAAAFHFTWLFNEQRAAGKILYGLFFAGWFIISCFELQSKKLSAKFTWFAGLVAFSILVYLPSLLVDENFPSNRTLFALDMVVFVMVTTTVFSFIRTQQSQYLAAGIIAFFFLINAWYNFQQQFIHPLTTEFSVIKNAVITNYSTDIDTVFFIRPPENAFEKKYSIVASGDEFGVPSTAKKWTAEPLIKQLIFEKTGNRQTAERIVVKSWENSKAFTISAETITKRVLVINAAQLME